MRKIIAKIFLYAIVAVLLILTENLAAAHGVKTSRYIVVAAASNTYGPDKKMMQLHGSAGMARLLFLFPLFTGKCNDVKN